MTFACAARLHRIKAARVPLESRAPIDDELENIMTRIALCATLSALLAVPALAQSIDASGRQAVGFEQRVTSSRGTSSAPSLGAGGGVAVLRRYGDRFEKAIGLIGGAAARPGWGWEDGCGHVDAAVTSVPET